jgi:ABC-type nitrate/sulfonate/bicarbonate transport system ATPase subunit
MDQTIPPHQRRQRVDARYRTANGGDLLALDNISFSVPRGEFVSIVGPSGCGKSTLPYVVAGCCRPRPAGCWRKAWNPSSIR